MNDPLLDATRLATYLREHTLPPLHRFGQHFLVDADVLHSIVEASDTDPAIPVIEIGAGLGVLTRALAREREQATGSRQRGTAPLIAVELDRRLIPLLKERTKEFPSVHVMHGDILKLELPEVFRRTMPHAPFPMPYDVIGNIPYNITAPILKKFLTKEPRPRRVTLLVDHSVAEAIAAEPPQLSIRAISVQVFAEPTISRGRIPPSAFVPPPEVASALLTLRTRTTPLVAAEEESMFFRLVRAGFSQKRKTLANALAATARIPTANAAARLRRADIDPSRRAQTLSIAEWKMVLKYWEEPDDSRADSHPLVSFGHSREPG